MFENRIEYLEYAFLVCVLPAVSLFFIPMIKINKRKLLFCCYYSLYLIAIISLCHIRISSSGTTSGILSLYYISYGHLGASLAFLSFFIIFQKSSDGEPALIYRIIYFIGGLLGLLIVYLASARGPVVAFCLMLAFYFIINQKAGGRSIFLYILSVIIVISLFFIFNCFLSSHFHSSFFIRANEMLQGNTNGRLERWHNAIVEFINNPFIGGDILLQQNPGIGGYPHNIILEVMMATGLLGLSLFMTWFWNVWKSGKYIVDNLTSSWVIYLFIQYLVFGLTSGSIFTNSYFWYFSAFVICLGRNCRELKFIS